MRRIGIIVLSLVIVLALGSGVYAYVAKQRQMWPFNSSPVASSLVTASSFSALLPTTTAIYAQLDLANSNVQTSLASNPALQKNINLLKTGLQQLGNSMLQNQIGMMTQDTADQQKVGTQLINALQYLGSKKIDIAWDASDSSVKTASQELPGSTLVAIESNSAEEAKETLTTIKSLLTQGNERATVQDIQVAGMPVSQVTVTTTTTEPDYSAELIWPSEGDDSTALPTIPNKTTTKVTITYILNLNNQFIVISTQKPAIEQLIQRSQTPTANNLKNDPTFTGLVSKLHGAQLATVYMDTAKYAQIAAQLSSAGTPEMAAMNQQMTNALLETPIYQSHSVFSFTLNDKGVYGESYMSFTNPQAASIYAGHTTTSFANATPDSALEFMEGNNFTQMASMILMPLMQSMNADPALAEGPMAALQSFEQSTGISLQNDIAPLFSQTTAISIDRSSSILMPVAMTILTQVPDQAKAMATMSKITKAIVTFAQESAGVPLPEPTTAAINGVDVHSFGSLDGTETLYNYGFLKDGKTVALTTAQSAFKKLLETMAKPSTSLAQSTKYPELLKNQTAANSMIYLDIKGIVDTFIPLIRVAMPTEEGQAYDTEVKPYVEILNNFASYGVLDGNMVKSVMQLQLVQ